MDKPEAFKNLKPALAGRHRAMAVFKDVLQLDDNARARSCQHAGAGFFCVLACQDDATTAIWNQRLHPGIGLTRMGEIRSVSRQFHRLS